MSLFGNKLNGHISMQILLLEELGYTVVTVSQNIFSKKVIMTD